MLQYLLSFVLAILIYFSTFFIEDIFPDIGYQILTYAYISILLGLILYYFLTTYLKIGLTILSFILNFIIWVAEQVNLEKEFHNTFFYQNDDAKIFVVLLGGFLWTTNKLLIDTLYIKLKAYVRPLSKLDNLFKKVRKEM